MTELHQQPHRRQATDEGESKPLALRLTLSRHRRRREMSGRHATAAAAALFT